MALSVYDSPTFLDQKDKYMLGLSLPQLMLVFGVGFTLFLFSLALPFGLLIRLSVVGVCTCLISLLLFVRLSGLSVPSYLIAWVMSMFRKPVYEEHQLLLLNGSFVWLEAKQERRSKLSRVPFLSGSKKVTDDVAMQAMASELQAELDSQVVQGSVAAEQFVKDGFRVLFKGR